MDERQLTSDVDGAMADSGRHLGAVDAPVF
jgi:hypothetical protein